MHLHFVAAPWPIWVKLTSAIGSIGMLVIALILHNALSAMHAIPPLLIAVITALPLLALAASALFVVRGYTLQASELRVQRLCFDTCITLTGLSQAWADPTICRGSIRLLGNGGMFAVTGLFRNAQLGRYRLFATDTRNAVVLRLPNQTVVITPARPHALIEQLRFSFAGLQTGKPATAGN